MGEARRGQKGKRGATLALMAAMTATVLALCAVAIDMGMLYSARGEAQRTADAAALAGAGQYMFYNDPAQAVHDVDSAARVFAKNNVIRRAPVTDADIMSVTPLPASRSVEVVIQRSRVPTMFAATFGIASSDIRVAATAAASDAGRVQCIKPIAIPDIWAEPGRPTGGDTITGGAGNKVWDLPPPPATGNRYNSAPSLEAWRFNGSDTYTPGTMGYGTTYRSGIVGKYQTAKSWDFGRRLVLSIEDPGLGIQPSSFYQAWGARTGGGNSPGGTSSGSVAAGLVADCGIASADISTVYVAANGVSAGQIGPAWDQLYDRDPGASWDDANNKVVGSNKCPATGDCTEEDWMQSKRVITVGVYDPRLYGTSPSNNQMAFTNFATVFVEKPYGVGHGNNPKRWVTGIFLRYTTGIGGGATTGSLIKTIQLIR